MQTIKKGDFLQPPQKRKRLASPAVVFTTGIAVIFLMVFLFPRSTWFRQVSNISEKERGDSLKIVMLRDLINNGQNNLTVSEDYAKQLALMGNYKQAFVFVDSLLKLNMPDSQFTLRRLEAELAQQTLNLHTSKAIDSIARLHSNLALESLVVKPLPTPTLEWTADVANRSGRKDLAIKMYAELAKLDTLRAKDWYEQAAALAMQQGDYLMSSDLFFRAENRSRNFKDKKNAFLSAMRTLQASNNLDQALTQGELQIQNLTSDSEVLLFMVKLARAAGQTKVAEKYARLLVKPQVSYRVEK